MHLLYYWRPDNYRRDRAFGFGFHLNQNSPMMTKAAEGDSLWAFTRSKKTGFYVIAANLVIRAVTTNSERYRYGKYRAWGHLERSRFFQVDEGPNAEGLIRSLTVPAKAELLGQSFQGNSAVRSIPQADHDRLEEFSAGLSFEEAEAIFAEDQIEAGMLFGMGGMEVMAESEGKRNKRLAYLFSKIDPQRSSALVRDLREMYSGRCQLCGFDPVADFGVDLCHAHHIVWLSRDGEDSLENLMLLCPNHHALVHKKDLPFDFSSRSFLDTGDLSGLLRLNEHLG